MPALMARTVVDVVAALLDGDSKALKEWANAEHGLASHSLAIRLAAHIADGQYAAVFDTDKVTWLLAIGGDDATPANLAELSECVSARTRSYLSDGEAEGDRDWREMVCVLAGAACVNAFMQNNVTGPPMERGWESLLPKSLSDKSEEVNQEVLKALAMDGEECYRLTGSAYYIYMAQVLLMDAQLSSVGALWWRARYCYVHQQLLSDWSNTLYTTYRESMDAVTASLEEFPAARKSQLMIRANVEYGIMGYLYQDIAKEMAHIVRAQELSGLVLEMTGALGRRTRWQTFDTPQLVLKAKSDTAATAGAAADATAGVAKPVNMKLNDDTLLEEIAFSEHVEDQADLALLDQCIILASCLNVKNSNPKHGLTTEQMMPFVDRVLKETNATHNWLVYSMGLLLRSRLEGERSRTVERGVLQMQVLLDQYKDERGKNEASVAQRMDYVYCLAFPLYFNMQRELGQRYAGIGVLRSAQEIYERLEMWEDVVSCHMAMSEETKALKLCNELLAKEKTPRMLCVLGDLTRDKSKYTEAWELSGAKYTRAMRTLGRELLREGDAAGCVECLKKATAINPLQEGTWFTMGCAALQIQDWETAITAFRRCIAINEENGESWNNLGSAYIKLGDKVKAAHSLQQALKYSFDNWQMWENYLNVTTDTKDVHSAMQAIHRLIDIRPQKFSDVVVIRANMDTIIERLRAADDQHTKDTLTKKWGEVMGRCQSVMSQNADLWEVCADWYRFKGDAERVVDCLQKAYRVSSKAGWEREASTVEQVAARALALSIAQLEQETASAAHSAKLMLRSLVKKTEAEFSGTAVHEQLREALEQAEALETRLKASQ